MYTPLSALEDVAYQVVTSMKLHPKIFGGDYRVWFENTTSGFKKELAVWFNHSSSGAAVHKQQGYFLGPPHSVLQEPCRYIVASSSPHNVGHCVMALEVAVHATCN